MKAISIVILAVLVFLAAASGITKILLLPQDVDFFGKYGFSDPILIGFGLAQLLGGLFLIHKKTRLAGAAIVAATFVISLGLLLLEGKIAVSIVTLVAILLLGIVMKQSWRPA